LEVESVEYFAAAVAPASSSGSCPPQFVSFKSFNNCNAPFQAPSALRMTSFATSVRPFLRQVTEKSELSFESNGGYLEDMLRKLCSVERGRITAQNDELPGA
jgi:hypothetical protein